MDLRQEEEILSLLQEITAKPPVLPYEPTLIPMLFAATRDGSHASTRDLTHLIERSQKLAARILSIANSPAFALGSPVSSLNRAVSILGFNEVRALIVLAGASSIVERSKLPVLFDGVGLWQHQILTACIAKDLAAFFSNSVNGQNIPRVDPDEAYAAGLLHDIGQIFLALYKPDVWGAINTRVQKGKNFYDAEEEHWGMQHGTIAAQVLRIWQFPAVLIDMIEWHHQPMSALSHKAEVKILAAADSLALMPPANGVLPDSVKKLLPQGADFALVGALVQETINQSTALQLAQTIY